MSLSFYKKIIVSIFASLIFVFSFVSSFAASSGVLSTVNKTISDVGNTVKLTNNTIVSNIILLLGGVALVVFLWGLVLFLYHRNKGANDGKDLEKDKQAILWGLVAMFVMATLWGIIIMARDMIGISSDNNILLPKICVGNSCGSSVVSQSNTSGTTQTVQSTPSVNKLNVTDNYCSAGQVKARDGDYPNACVSVGSKCDNYGGVYDSEGDCITSCTYPSIIAKDGDYANSCVSIGSKCDNSGGVYDSEGDCVDSNNNPAQGYPEVSNSSRYVQRDSDCVADATTKCSIDGVGLVTYIQTLLKSKNCLADKVDGIFGTNTFNAVKAFQNVNKLKADGIVGDTTWQIILNGRQGGYLSSCK